MLGAVTQTYTPGTGTSLVDSVSVWKAQVWNRSHVRLVLFTNMSVPLKTQLPTLPAWENKGSVLFSPSQKAIWCAWQLLLANYGANFSAWGLLHQQVLEQFSNCSGKLGYSELRPSTPISSTGCHDLELLYWQGQGTNPAPGDWLCLCSWLLEK